MKTLIWLGALSALVGCQNTGVAGAAGEGDIGVTEQASQFADNTVVNFADMTSATLSFTADINPVTLNIFGVNDVTTDTGHTVGNVTLLKTLTLAADQTQTYTVPFGNTAIAKGAGCIFIDSIGSSPSDVFQTHVVTGDQVWSVGGSVFTGGSYRMPYPKNTKKFVLSMTNLSDFDFEVQIYNVQGTSVKTITLPVLSTYKMDSSALGWTFSTTAPGSVQLFTTNGGVVSLSGYYTVGTSTTKNRFYPVKAAPYF